MFNVKGPVCIVELVFDTDTRFVIKTCLYDSSNGFVIVIVIDWCIDHAGKQMLDVTRCEFKFLLSVGRQTYKGSVLQDFGCDTGFVSFPFGSPVLGTYLSCYVHVWVGSKYSLFTIVHTIYSLL